MDFNSFYNIVTWRFVFESRFSSPPPTSQFGYVSGLGDRSSFPYTDLYYYKIHSN